MLSIGTGYIEKIRPNDATDDASK